MTGMAGFMEWHIRGAIFDLDGVLVDTASYHFRAWKRLAQELGFSFTEQDNERLKGVSRMRSLELLLETGGMAEQFSMMEKDVLAARKNTWYVEMLESMSPDEILPGALECLHGFRAVGIRTSLGSASRNAGRILHRLGLTPMLDAIVDGNDVERAKPAPDVFLLAAKRIGIPPSACVVFEDAQAGLEAACSGGMRAIAVGNSESLSGFDARVAGLYEIQPAEWI
jgi:beta-phosphoglucomutase